ncbi:MAG: hypothetical protein QOH58_912, partial [Thermoleophilaceae bacterium]|nr:hypothetical protein [Thermoleophilaceae bacterium]
DGVYLQGALFHADGMPPSELIAMVDSELARLAGP